MPKPRILPFVILGILSQNDHITAYDILDEFNNEIGEFWKSSHSQLYPELNKMVAEELISKTTDEPRKFYYTATDKGLIMLNDWFLEPITEHNEDLTSLKIYFIADQNSDILKYILKSSLKVHQEKLDHFLKRKADLFTHATDIQHHYGHYLILDRAIEREENHIAWLTSHQ